ncbi:uncharacterized protein LOC144940854 [Lampetra fluviatilis]
MAQPGPRRPNPAGRSAEAAENGGGGGGGGCCRLFQRSDSMAARSVQLIEVLDKLEHRVEALRDQAYAMEQEKEALVELIQEARSSHDMWRISEGEKEELAMTAERLLSRTLSVAVSLETVRSAAQREALRRATALVDGVAEQLQGAGDGDDPGITAAADAAACRLLSFRNACSSEPSAGAVDHKFQATVISCALEDQKRLKRRVEMLLRGVRLAGASLDDDDRRGGRGGGDDDDDRRRGGENAPHGRPGMRHSCQNDDDDGGGGGGGASGASAAVTIPVTPPPPLHPPPKSRPPQPPPAMHIQKNQQQQPWAPQPQNFLAKIVTTPPPSAPLPHTPQLQQQKPPSTRPQSFAKLHPLRVHLPQRPQPQHQQPKQQQQEQQQAKAQAQKADGPHDNDNRSPQPLFHLSAEQPRPPAQAFPCHYQEHKPRPPESQNQPRNLSPLVHSPQQRFIQLTRNHHQPKPQSSQNDHQILNLSPQHRFIQLTQRHSELKPHDSHGSLCGSALAFYAAARLAAVHGTFTRAAHRLSHPSGEAMHGAGLISGGLPLSGSSPRAAAPRVRDPESYL